MKLDRRAKFNKVTHLLSDPRSFSRFSRVQRWAWEKSGWSAAFRPRWCASRASCYRCAPAASSPAPTDPLPLLCRARRPAAWRLTARRRRAGRIWRQTSSGPLGWCGYRGQTARWRTRTRRRSRRASSRSPATTRRTASASAPSCLPRPWLHHLVHLTSIHPSLTHSSIL